MTNSPPASAAAVLISIFAAIAGCRGDLSYSTRAVYGAPESGFEVLAIGSGVVPAGADIADRPSGVAWFCPRAEGRPLRLTFSGSDTVGVQLGDEQTTIDWFFRDRTARVANLLSMAGYPVSDSVAIEEAIEVIGGALLGPKATTLVDQAEVLEVIEVEHHYDRRFDGRLDDFSCASLSGGGP